MTQVLNASPAASSGTPHVDEPSRYDGILLVGFGGPEGPDDVMPFLRNVTKGRGIPDERLTEVAEHYHHYNGVSPINTHNRELKAALQKELTSRGIGLPVFWGNRNWAPYLHEAIADADAKGATSLLATVTSAFSSYSSCRQYREDLWEALRHADAVDRVTIDKVRQYFDHPGFVEPFVDGVDVALRSLESDGLDITRDIEVLFVTHSIPSADAQNSGPHDLDLGAGGAYEAQHRAIADVVMRAVSSRRRGRDEADAPAEWQLVYQSRSGAPSTPWLEPDVNDAIAELASSRRAVVVVPIGFVSDHMEVMWDLDNEARETADAHGLAMIRVATPGTHPAFVSGLADLIEERIDGTPPAGRPALTALGPWFDVCRPGCCASARAGARCAVAGLKP
ncbi:ferrochelatase [Paramicrobacterium agarici]|uniref:ferrochelatase n=1 Tax=Paramicrobacterium agarici TaxID=630514 RepID=UPI0011534C0F|nr:ferrochelatase [Microbacterium agarici]TQO23649.1 ferrochelatase [Microbacterium agarici]